MAKDWENVANGIVARNVADEEIGRFDRKLPEINLDQAARDQLLLRGRQDAAHALLNTISLMKEMEKLRAGRRWAWRGVLFGFGVSVIALGWAALR